MARRQSQMKNHPKSHRTHRFSSRTEIPSKIYVEYVIDVKIFIRAGLFYRLLLDQFGEFVCAVVKMRPEWFAVLYHSFYMIFWYSYLKNSQLLFYISRKNPWLFVCCRKKKKKVYNCIFIFVTRSSPSQLASWIRNSKSSCWNSHQLNGIIWQSEIVLLFFSIFLSLCQKICVHCHMWESSQLQNKKNSISSGIKDDSKTDALIPRERKEEKS